MAEENHDGISELLLSLQDNENSSTLLPTLTGHANDNSGQFSNLKPDVNLQLSLGGFYDKTPNPAPALPIAFANPGKSVLKRSYFELNKFMPNQVAEIKITREVQVITKTKNQEGGSAETSENGKSSKEVLNTLVSPPEILVWAAQSAAQNPAFQRALNVIKSEGGILRATRSTTSRVDTTIKPHRLEGSGSGLSIFYLKNGNSMDNRFNYGTNPRSDMLQKHPQNLNLVAPANFSGASGNGNLDQQFQNVKYASPFSCFLATMDRLPNCSGGLYMHPKLSAFAASSSGAKISSPIPAPFGTGGNNILMMPPNATCYYERSQIPSNFLSNPKVPPFVPSSSRANATGIPFMPHHHEPNRPFPGSAVTPVPLLEFIDGSRVHQNSINPPKNPNKRAKLDNQEILEAELELMKQLPTVVTTGGNPDGKKTEGLLYKYGSNEEVIIVCLCHGCFLSPEEFVRHAGGSNVDNPRQQICVLPFPD